MNKMFYEQTKKFEKYAFLSAWLPKEELLKSLIVNIPSQAMTMLDVPKMKIVHLKY